jgi:CAAX protease family protein
MKLDRGRTSIVPRSTSPLKFFVLVFALSIPFWLLGAVTDLQLLPGLPMSALALFCPVTAAAILVHRQNGTSGVIRLLKRALDYQRISAKVWCAPILLLMPAVMVLSYGLMRVMGMPLATPQFSVLGAVVLFLAFVLGGAAEELGWSGYVIDPMQRRWTALQASILLGSVWATWHLVALVQADRSLTWIAGWCLSTVAQRVLMVWIYNNTRNSVFGAILFHATSNLGWQLFPNHGSHYDPRVTGVILAFAAAVVTVIWGPRTLARYRNS